MAMTWYQYVKDHFSLSKNDYRKGWFITSVMLVKIRSEALDRISHTDMINIQNAAQAALFLTGQWAQIGNTFSFVSCF